MKIYTAKYDANRPALKQINIPNFSSAKIGIEVYKNGEKLELDESNVVMKSGDTTISADGVYDDFVTVPVSTGDCGDDNLYKVEINKPRAYETEDVVLTNLAPGSRHSMTTTLTLQTTENLDGFLASINDIPLKPENFSCTTVDKSTEEIYELPSRFAFFYTDTKPLWYVKNRGTPAQAIWKWYNSITKEYKDELVYPTDFAETVISYGFYGSGYQDTETGTTTIKIGEPFSDSFKLVINSAKSSVLDAEITADPEPVEETDPVFTAWKDGQTVAIGKDSFATGENTTAVGPYAIAEGDDSAALGFQAAARAQGSIQIGQGVNNEINTVQIKDYQILDADGKIPAERLPGGITTFRTPSSGYVEVPVNVQLPFFITTGDDLRHPDAIIYKGNEYWNNDHQLGNLLLVTEIIEGSDIIVIDLEMGGQGSHWMFEG